MVWTKHDYERIPGTYVFNGERAAKGLALNRMCLSFNEEEKRQAFLADEDGYCDSFGISAEQKQAIKDRDVIGLLKLGGNIYYLAKFIGIFDWNMQDIGAIQTGVSLEEFRAKLLAEGKDLDG